MKRILIAIFGTMALGSCNWLEVPSSYVLSSDTVENKPELVETQFLSYYPLLRGQLHTIGLLRNTCGYHHFDTWVEDGVENIVWMMADKKKFSPGYCFGQMFQMTPYYKEDSGEYWPYWPYDLINKLTKTIKSFDENAEDEDISHMMGEAYFIRAYLYFGLVERYGGVPVFTEPFDDAGAINNRISEEAAWDFVGAQLDSAIKYLPEQAKYASENRDRAIRNTALALKSRVMLYAGTLAKYGPEPFNGGLQGIPSGRSKDYLQKAAQAAQEVIDNGMYSLSSGSFAALFDGTDENNSEIIFRFSTEPKTVGMYIWWDRYFAPVRYQESSGAFMVPSLEAVECFETLDGQIKELDYDTEYPNLYSIFAGRDKRLYGTILLPGETFLGLTMDIYNRSVVHTSTGDLNYQWSDWTEWNQRVTIPHHENYYRSGLDGGWSQTEGKGTTNTGFYVKKMLYGASHLDKYDEGLGSQDAVVLRYAEVILNYAEAAIELAEAGDGTYLADARALFNSLREIHGGLPAKALTIESVRHERRVETMFECLRYWDIKRWHQAELVHGMVPHVIQPVLHIDETKNPEKVYYTIGKDKIYDMSSTETKWFEERDYYCPLPCDITPGLVQNIGWEGEITASIFDHYNR